MYKTNSDAFIHQITTAAGNIPIQYTDYGKQHRMRVLYKITVSRSKVTGNRSPHSHTHPVHIYSSLDDLYVRRQSKKRSVQRVPLAERESSIRRQKN